ncbi:helix-turn-helix domain-containing protein [Methylovulum psychrotolerans]|uniref:Helix-turn-helix domain-containing protein n=1 Tax=Methylovulum psychrotolerans TaxID=1704499 RepID=A0A2S5CGH7_9GAMM|nr:helix-turn-helix domain-containing protein [Methylovulum psychrotolerans]POZ49867.1 helix-turn-helix domain-containing protein [Methylovulum psychrotolerans]
MNYPNDAALVVERLKLLLKVDSDKSLAEELGISTPTVSSWRQRNSIPYEACIEIATKNNVRLDWLIIGKGEMYSGQSEIKEQMAMYSPAEPDIKAQKVVELFMDLNETQQREIFFALEEKKQINEMKAALAYLMSRSGDGQYQATA